MWSNRTFTSQLDFWTNSRVVDLNQISYVSKSSRWSWISDGELQFRNSFPTWYSAEVRSVPLPQTSLDIVAASAFGSVRVLFGGFVCSVNVQSPWCACLYFVHFTSILWKATLGLAYDSWQRSFVEYSKSPSILLSAATLLCSFFCVLVWIVSCWSLKPIHNPLYNGTSLCSCNDWIWHSVTGQRSDHCPFLHYPPCHVTCSILLHGTNQPIALCVDFSPIKSLWVVDNSNSGVAHHHHLV